MKTTLRTAALALALPGVMAASLPAAAATWQPASADQSMVYRDHDDDGDRWEHRGDRYRGESRSDQRAYGQRSYQQPYYNDNYNNQQTWRGNDGRYYCKKKNGTTGLIVGGAAGALLGRSVERSSSTRCR